jgi:hypothetical protein
MADSSGTISRFLNSPRRQRQLLIGSAAVLVIGVIALTVTVLLKSNGNKFTNTFSNQKATLYKPDKKAPISTAQIALARRFIKTAVARQDLDASYNLVHADLKGRLTRKEWDTGNIPVVSYQAANADTAKFTVDYSYQRSALLEVDLIAKGHTQTRPELLFFLGLKRVGDKPNGRWLVNYWEPHWHPPVPAPAG